MQKVVSVLKLVNHTGEIPEFKEDLNNGWKIVSFQTIGKSTRDNTLGFIITALMEKEGV
jgi:hypothetical protein